MEARPKHSPAEDEILRRCRLLVLDVDGVLTDGSIVYDAYGPAGEHQSFHVHDGIAQRWLRREGVVIAWITGRGCLATRARATELEVDEYHERAKEKGAVLEGIQTARSIEVRDTVVMGDDLPDLPLAARAALFAAPANATSEIKARAQWISSERGGSGAVRELCERILRAKGRWQAILDASSR